MTEIVRYNELGELRDTPELRARLNHVNRSVNARINYKTDLELYRRKDFWAVVDGRGYGDCDDYAMSKRDDLLSLGVHQASLCMATCWTETSEYHAVLIVKTDLADLVLDNRYDKVVSWHMLPYKWHKIQVPGKSKWLEIKAQQKPR